MILAARGKFSFLWRSDTLCTDFILWHGSGSWIDFILSVCFFFKRKNTRSWMNREGWLPRKRLRKGNNWIKMYWMKNFKLFENVKKINLCVTQSYYVRPPRPEQEKNILVTRSPLGITPAFNNKLTLWDHLVRLCTHVCVCICMFKCGVYVISGTCACLVSPLVLSYTCSPVQRV